MTIDFVTGLLPATLTPLHEDGTVNYEVIPTIVDHLESQGVAGIYILGTTGEGGLLTIEERQSVAEAFILAAEGRMPVVVQVGHESVAESRGLAAHADRCGASAVSAMCPTYFAPGSLDSLVEWVARVAAAAPDLPFYYYHIPCRTGVDFSMTEFLGRCDEQVPSLRGIKYTSSSLHEYYTCLELQKNRYDILFGFDEMLLGAVAVGARGAVGSTYNFSAGLATRILDLCSRGNWEDARQAQYLIGSMIHALARHDFIPAVKAVMKMIGIDCGPCRLPCKTLSREDYLTLKADLESIGFLSTAANGLSIVNASAANSKTQCEMDK